MKRLILILAVVALATPLAAQEKTEVFAFFDDPSFGHSSNRGTSANSGYGVSLRYFATPRFAAELSVARHDKRFVAYDLTNPSAPVLIADETVRVAPIDLIGSYHFTTDSRWRPYVGAGLHYLSVSGSRNAPSLTAQIVGGVAFHVTEHFFVRADGKVLLNNGTKDYEDQGRGLLGLGWRF